MLFRFDMVYYKPEIDALTGLSDAEWFFGDGIISAVSEDRNLFAKIRMPEMKPPKDGMYDPSWLIDLSNSKLCKTVKLDFENYRIILMKPLKGYRNFDYMKSTAVSAIKESDKYLDVISNAKDGYVDSNDIKHKISKATFLTKDLVEFLKMHTDDVIRIIMDENGLTITGSDSGETTYDKVKPSGHAECYITRIVREAIESACVREDIHLKLVNNTFVYAATPDFKMIATACSKTQVLEFIKGSRGTKKNADEKGKRRPNRD